MFRIVNMIGMHTNAQDCKRSLEKTSLVLLETRFLPDHSEDLVSSIASQGRPCAPRRRDQQAAPIESLIARGLSRVVTRMGGVKREPVRLLVAKRLLAGLLN